MKHVSKRLVSMLLVLCMVLSVLPLSVFAAPGQTLKVAFRYRIVPAGGGSWSGEADRSEEYAVHVDADGAFELALPAGFEEVFPNAEFRGRLSNKLFDGWTGVGPTVAYDADTKTARVTGCTDVLDETKTYLIDVVYNEQFYKVSFGDDIRENLTWNDIVKIPAVPASGDVNRWGLGWTANGRQYLPGGEARVSELFAGIPRGTTELELEPAYLDLTDRHIVLWTDGLSGEVYRVDTVADGETVPTPPDVTFGDTVVLAEPMLPGYVFKGWQYGDNLYSNNGVKDFTVEANEAREMTLEAVWASDSYSVTYRSEGMDDETVSDLRYGELHVPHDAPERAGYLFGGWEELETGAVYNARQAVSITCDMLLRAIWTEVPAGKAAVKFVNNGDLYDIILVDKGSNGVAPETAPTRPGYTFVEWRCDALNSFVRAGEPFGVAADADDLIVYTAVYTRNGYKLHFNLDGGSPDYADIIDVGYGETVALADVAEKTGYEFSGLEYLPVNGKTFDPASDAVAETPIRSSRASTRATPPRAGSSSSASASRSAWSSGPATIWPRSPSPATTARSPSPSRSRTASTTSISGGLHHPRGNGRDHVSLLRVHRHGHDAEEHDVYGSLHRPQ